MALYLAAHVAFRLRMGGTLSYTRLWAVGALAVLFAAGADLPAWAVAGAVTVVLAALCAIETARERRTAVVLSR